MIGVLDEQAIDQILENNIVGRLGYRDGERMYIIPVSYLYFSEKYIIVHSREGQKIDILRKYPDVCFEVDEIDSINNYRGVLVWGKYEELTDLKERHYALSLLLRKINKQKIAETGIEGSPLAVADDMMLPDKEKKVVYRIRIEEKSGRFEMNAPEYQNKEQKQTL